jgi:CelD/BcsL family acetyltransferase involved in cellulose biosynthesis
VTAAAAGTLHTTESIADAAAFAAEASAEAKAAAALWRGLEYWPLELGTVHIAWRMLYLAF